MLYSQADSKKKSNLMMSIFEPGSEPLPWLGKISHLGPISGNLLVPACVSMHASVIFLYKQWNLLSIQHYFNHFFVESNI